MPYRAKRILSIVLFLATISISGCTVENPYTLHHKHQTQQTQEIHQRNTFSLTDITPIEGISFLSTPSIQTLDQIVTHIEQAKKHVFLEMYILTEKRIQKALKKAYERGVDVKVILEKNVYKAPNINKKTYEYLKNAGIPIIWANNQHYKLTHTKLMIIDDIAFLSTANYSYSSFYKNREFFLKITNPSFVALLQELFHHDFSYIPYTHNAPHLVLSPYNTRKKIETLLSASQKSIDIYAPSISDAGFIQILIKQAQRGIRIRIIVPPPKNDDRETKELYDTFQKHGIQIKMLASPYPHAKSLLIDEKYLYIGSINFSSPSFDENREIGLILSNTPLIQEVKALFENDFKK